MRHLEPRGDGGERGMGVIYMRSSCAKRKELPSDRFSVIRKGALGTKRKNGLVDDSSVSNRRSFSDGRTAADITTAVTIKITIKKTCILPTAAVDRTCCVHRTHLYKCGTWTKRECSPVHARRSSAIKLRCKASFPPRPSPNHFDSIVRAAPSCRRTRMDAEAFRFSGGFPTAEHTCCSCTVFNGATRISGPYNCWSVGKFYFFSIRTILTTSLLLSGLFNSFTAKKPLQVYFYDEVLFESWGLDVRHHHRSRLLRHCSCFDDKRGGTGTEDKQTNNEGNNNNNNDHGKDQVVPRSQKYCCVCVTSAALDPSQPVCAEPHEQFCHRRSRTGSRNPAELFSPPVLIGSRPLTFV